MESQAKWPSLRTSSAGRPPTAASSGRWWGNAGLGQLSLGQPQPRTQPPVTDAAWRPTASSTSSSDRVPSGSTPSRHSASQPRWAVSGDEAGQHLALQLDRLGIRASLRPGRRGGRRDAATGGGGGVAGGTHEENSVFGRSATEPLAPGRPIWRPVSSAPHSRSSATCAAPLPTQPPSRTPGHRFSRSESAGPGQVTGCGGWCPAERPSAGWCPSRIHRPRPAAGHPACSWLGRGGRARAARNGGRCLRRPGGRARTAAAPSGVRA